MALELSVERLLIDEREGRALARTLGLRVTGVLGVLLRARKTQRLSAIKPEIETLRNRARFFISPTLEQAVLASAGELESS